MICATCNEREALRGNAHCLPCWQEWFASLQVLGAVRRAEAELRRRQLKESA